MNIYIAGEFPAQERLRNESMRFDDMDLWIASTWLQEAPQDVSGRLEKLGWAVRDLGEIDQSDILLLDTFGVGSKGGRDFEAGYAYAKGKRVLRIGPALSVFHELLPSFESWDEVNLG